MSIFTKLKSATSYGIINALFGAAAPDKNNPFITKDELAEKMDMNISIVEVTDNYTIKLSDNNKLLSLNKVTAITLTIPLNSNVAFPVNPSTQLLGFQHGAGQVTIAAEAGVTIVSPQGNVKTQFQYSGFSLVKIGTNTWWLSGDLTA